MSNVVDFWFDPICPWCWITSRWIGEVEKVRDIEVRWHVFSLATINEGRELEPSYRKFMDNTWGPARVAQAVAEQYPEQLKHFYDVLGNEIHHRENTSPGDKYLPAIEQALASAGLPAELLERALNDESAPGLATSIAAAQELVGNDVGVPIIAFNGVGFFGPVISPSPAGEEAGKLFDAAVTLAHYPGFFELKRTRTVGPIFHGEDQK